MSSAPTRHQPEAPRFVPHRRTLAQLVALLSALMLTFWMRGDAPLLLAQVSPPPQVEPAEPDGQAPPQELSTPDPLVATVTPVSPGFPAEPPATQPMATDAGLPAEPPTPLPAQTTPGPLDPAADATEPVPPIALTPDGLLILPPAVTTATPEPTPRGDSLAFVVRVIDSASLAAAWIWLGCGSVIFFAVAGTVAGLIFAQRERRRYHLYEVVPEERAVLPTASRSDDAEADDDYWPASLP